MNIQGATGVLYNITGGTNLTLMETSEAAEIIRAAVDEDAEIIYGTSIDPSLGDGVTITLIATGFDQGRAYDQPVVRQMPRAQQDQRPQRTSTTPPPRPSQPPRQATSQPVFPDDEWSNESSIIKFLRDR